MAKVNIAQASIGRLRVFASRTRGSRVLVFCLFLITASACSGQQGHPTDTQVKAAYLYNFGKFVRFPDASALSSFNICILGRDPFQDALQSAIAGESIGGMPLTVRELTDGNDISACRVLYISGAELRRFRPLLAQVRHLPILTVSDGEEFLRQGGIVQFVMVGDRVRFEVNLDAAHQARLDLSSELLKVATRVIGNNFGSGERP